MTTPLLEAIRRLPLHVAKEHAGEERISLEQFKDEHPEGFFQWEAHEDEGYFQTLEEAGAFERKNFEPEIDEINIPYVLIPCKPVQLEAPSAQQLLIDAYEDQDAPDSYTVADAPSLQSLLDWWFKHHTKRWWVMDEMRVIVLLPEERKQLFKECTGKDFNGTEPGISEFLTNLSSEEVVDQARMFNEPVYNVELLVERKMSGDPNWSVIDDGQEATPVDDQVSEAVKQLEEDGWEVTVQNVEPMDKDELADSSPDARSTGDDVSDDEDEEDAEDTEEADEVSDD